MQKGTKGGNAKRDYDAFFFRLKMLHFDVDSQLPRKYSSPAVTIVLWKHENRKVNEVIFKIIFFYEFGLLCLVIKRTIAKV